ncbi:AIPR family protein [Hydrogenivirga sp. 128-5-R1-1]|uniref:AIPR family protein n=1 Tax=Hydrogenivirga sp. 128-5-R1-1 TaxID=392423 RepID=UPI00015F2776|nr:AIPR family protein [Hydrogenivirga sp. 128-5-R1-1]EDP73969.1 hypothetical protein HG1285_09271 [Hydrogenivirga sp. 128-5-R1-1]
MDIDIGLNAKINLFVQKFGINKEEIDFPDLFEMFSNYVIISNELEEDIDDFNSILTGKSKGIDGIGIIINDKLIKDLSDLENFKDIKINSLKYCFIQSTTKKSFSEEKFQAYIDTIIDFLLNNIEISPFSDIHREIFSEHINNIQSTPIISIYFSSAKTKHELTEEFIEGQKRKIISREDLENRFNLDNIYFLQKDELKGLFENIETFHKVDIEVEESFQLKEKEKIPISVIASIKFKEFKKLILTTNNNLRDSLFVENPRSFLRETNVNKDIRGTLEDDNLRDYFIFFNNGLTILCDKIEKHPVKRDTFILHYPRIINGCQTTHVLYEFFKEKPQKADNIEIMVKLIATDDKSLKTDIIYSTNNQNPISKDLLSLNEFHKELEEYFIGKEDLDLYYERLRGQYTHINPPYKKIDKEKIAKIYISVFLREPHKMKSKALREIENYEQKGKIFKIDRDKNDILERYYYCGVLNYWLEKFQMEKIIELKSQTEDMHLLLSVDILLSKTKELITDRIVFLNNEENAKSIYLKATNLLESQDYLFERKGFYSGPKTKNLINFLENFND